MGYTTDFRGSFDITPPLTAAQVKTLEDVADTRHEGSRYPSLYCQWVPTDDGTHLCWDGGEKFYEYIGWLERLIDTYFRPWCCALNGTVTWHGEESEDIGKIIVVDNKVQVKRANITFS